VTSESKGVSSKGSPDGQPAPGSRRSWEARRWLWLPFLVVTLALTIAGLRGGQWQDVAGWFDSLCAACIGLTFG